jgi:magnesium transporter
MAPSTDDDGLSRSELLDAWTLLSSPERREGFLLLPRDEQEELFMALSSRDQARLVGDMPAAESRSWIRFLAPDDAADLLQELDPELQQRLLEQLDEKTRLEVRALLAYRADEAGGLMSPRFVRVRPDMTVEEAIKYVRKQAAQRDEMIYYTYVLDEGQRLLGVVSFRELFTHRPEQRIRDIMHTSLVTLTEDMGQVEVGQIFSKHNFLAIPVLDKDGRMKGIVTVDDVVDVVQEEATREMHKVAAVEAFQEPYLAVKYPDMFKRRGGWLAFLFLGEMFTATAMAYYEHEIAKAVVLVLFIPLIISSGGNSGSQASTLVVRAMALGQVRLKDWWRVCYRELFVGLSLGLLLGLLGLLRIVFWPSRTTLFGEHYFLIALTLACSLIGVTLFGCLAGSMLPFLLRRLKLDPATACAPFVATLVDVTGLIIYFTAASYILRGSLL